MGAMLAAFVAEIGIITWRDISGSTDHTVAGLPLPADYLAVIVVFGGLSLVPSSSNASKTATYIAWGLVVATALNLVNPANPLSSAKSVPAAAKTTAAKTTAKKASTA